VAKSRRDDFPNNYVGDLVPTERGWVVVPPTCCPDGHYYGEPGWEKLSIPVDRGVPGDLHSGVLIAV
jgi:hypothetical protein